MKAITLEQAGGIENLQLNDVVMPVIKDDEVLIQAKALSINPVDAKTRNNQDRLTYFFGDDKPYILGWDVAGIITETGSEVSGFKKGDEVFGMVNFPGKGRCYAEYVAAPAAQLALKPAKVTFQEAAAACLAALTALQSLSVGNTRQGDKVLIHAASGGVGHYAIQIAKSMGAYVIGTSSAANRNFVLDMGADEHIDYKAQKFEDVLDDIDVVLDLVGGNAERSAKITKKGGHIVCLPERLPQAIADRIRAQGVDVSQFNVKSNGEDMEHIAGLFESGKLRSVITKALTLEQIPLAHTEIETGKTVGKIVITL